ncbi:MAG: class I tRNA ligase family protein [Aquificaceae bacterium]|nr:class I tRNA ligase family protein [Aquificaceae bacterium]MCX8164928.1 class I tRNA ligase family protein [Aquificaceae bacterium]
MRVSDFLRANNLSIGDNVRLLFDRLGIEEERYLKELESKIGEPAKMSKSKGNTVDPEEAINKYGADTVRLYILFAGPVEKDFEWTDEGVQGAYRFLRRLWEFTLRHAETLKGISYSQEDFKNLEGNAREIRRKTHKTLKRYLQHMENFSFNTAIASIMELFNTLHHLDTNEKMQSKVLKESLEITFFMLYPITPHICEELWNRLGNDKLMILHPFPEPDEKALVVEEIELPVQVNGKLRAVIKVPADLDESEAREFALKDKRISQWLNGKEIRKAVYIKNKLLNLVV